MQLPTGHFYSPCGDNGVTIRWQELPTQDWEPAVHQVFATVMDKDERYVLDVVPAINSLTIFFDLPALLRRYDAASACDFMLQFCSDIFMPPAKLPSQPVKKIELPVCYDETYAPDLQIAAGTLGISTSELVARHCAQPYLVYMLGFQPGFPYMGAVPPGLRLPRKATPAPVAAGSVALADRYTGIYPFDSPGGWHIIGRTPVSLFNPDGAQLTLLQPGDEVHFYSITADEFKDYQGGHI